jgi:hypothetical protein
LVDRGGHDDLDEKTPEAIERQEAVFGVQALVLSRPTDAALPEDVRATGVPARAAAAYSSAVA